MKSLASKQDCRHLSSVKMRNSANPTLSSVPAHPFFATKTNHPASPTSQKPVPKVIDKLLKETVTNISQLAAAPSCSEVHRTSILSTYERLSSVNVLTSVVQLKPREESKLLSPNESPDQFHSTSGSSSITQSLPEHFAGVSFPTTPAIVINSLSKYLTNIEFSEILDYKTVYFLGIQSDKVHGDLSLPNCGYDDDRNDYRVVLGDHLDYRYEILEALGKGAFGKVLKCYDHKESTHVAVKVVRNAKRFHRQAQMELQILQVLRDRRVQNIVVAFDHFRFRNHVCLTFELLDVNLYDYLKQNRFRGFPLSWVRKIAVQLVSALIELKQCRIVHCDLKPENILFTDRNKGSIKLIDFGSACLETAPMYSYIQSRFYRSPEVILGVKYSYPIDMWSLGCVLSELYTGRPLFPGENETDQLLCIMCVLGYPPLEVLSSSSKKTLFFDPDGDVKVVPNSHGRKRMPGTVSLSKLVPSTDANLLDFILRKDYTGCIDWDPNTRLTPEQAKIHPFLIDPESPEMY